MANTVVTLAKEKAVVHRLIELEFSHFGCQRGVKKVKKVASELSTGGENTLAVLSGGSQIVCTTRGGVCSGVDEAPPAGLLHCFRWLFFRDLHPCHID